MSSSSDLVKSYDSKSQVKRLRVKTEVDIISPVDVTSLAFNTAAITIWNLALLKLILANRAINSIILKKHHE